MPNFRLVRVKPTGKHKLDEVALSSEAGEQALGRGRGAPTDDREVSRQQLVARVDGDHLELRQTKVLRPSFLVSDGKVVRILVGVTYLAFHGDEIRLLEKRHHFRVVDPVREAEEEEERSKAARVAEEAAAAARRRQEAEDAQAAGRDGASADASQRDGAQIGSLTPVRGSLLPSQADDGTPLHPASLSVSQPGQAGVTPLSRPPAVVLPLLGTSTHGVDPVISARALRAAMEMADAAVCGEGAGATDEDVTGVDDGTDEDLGQEVARRAREAFVGASRAKGDVREDEGAGEGAGTSRDPVSEAGSDPTPEQADAAPPRRRLRVYVLDGGGSTAAAVSAAAEAELSGFAGEAVTWMRAAAGTFGDVALVGCGPCVVVGEAQWRFRARGTRVGKQLHARDATLEDRTVTTHGTGVSGHAYVVPTDPESALWREDACSHVVHVVVPHARPSLPDPVPADALPGALIRAYARALCAVTRLLAESGAPGYTSEATDRLQRRIAAMEADAAGDADDRAAATVAADGSARGAGADSRKRPRSTGSPDTGAGAGAGAGADTDEAVGPDRTSEGYGTKRRTAQPVSVRAAIGWRSQLALYLERPEQHRDAIVHEDADCIIVRDKFPKARLHLLLLPRTRVLAAHTPAGLRGSDTSVLRMLHARARTVAARLAEAAGVRDLRFGYHTAPSMRPLHLHIISWDLVSPHMKTKRHWNSFATEFFLPADTVVERLAAAGPNDGLDLDIPAAEALLKSDLACHKCAAAASTMPALKRHLASCRA